MIAIVVLVLVGVGVWYLLAGRDGGTSKATSACPSLGTTSGAAGVQVKVLNGTLRSGLARRTSTELASHGFRVAGVGNVRTGLVTATAIRYGPDGRSAAEALRPWLATGRLQPDQRTGSAVDLVLGEDYVGLRSPQQVKALSPQPTSSATAPLCR